VRIAVEAAGRNAMAVRLVSYLMRLDFQFEAMIKPFIMNTRLKAKSSKKNSVALIFFQWAIYATKISDSRRSSCKTGTRTI
jgi:hypothetical protein